MLFSTLPLQIISLLLARLCVCMCCSVLKYIAESCRNLMCCPLPYPCKSYLCCLPVCVCTCVCLSNQINETIKIRLKAYKNSQKNTKTFCFDASSLGDPREVPAKFSLAEHSLVPLLEVCRNHTRVYLCMCTCRCARVCVCAFACMSTCVRVNIKKI